MSSLNMADRHSLEKLFCMSSGYVLNFSDRTFGEFVFEAVNADIHEQRYTSQGTSKANKLRTFWKVEPDFMVGKLLLALIDYSESLVTEATPEAKALTERCRQIATRLLAGGPSLPAQAVKGKSPQGPTSPNVMGPERNRQVVTLAEWAGTKERGFVKLAIVFSDIIGSTKLNEELGNAEWSKVRSAHLAQAHKVVEKHEGWYVKDVGDEVVAVFKNDVQALVYAMDLEKDTGHELVRIKSGVNSGEVEIVGGDVFGNEVNLTARIQAKASEGGIWMSSEVHRSWLGRHGKSSTSFAKHPSISLKGVDEPLTLWSLPPTRASIPGSMQSDAALNTDPNCKPSIPPHDSGSANTLCASDVIGYKTLEEISTTDLCARVRQAARLGKFDENIWQELCERFSWRGCPPDDAKLIRSLDQDVCRPLFTWTKLPAEIISVEGEKPQPIPPYYARLLESGMVATIEIEGRCIEERQGQDVHYACHFLVKAIPPDVVETLQLIDWRPAPVTQIQYRLGTEPLPAPTNVPIQLKRIAQPGKSPLRTFLCFEMCGVGSGSSIQIASNDATYMPFQAKDRYFTITIEAASKLGAKQTQRFQVMILPASGAMPASFEIRPLPSDRGTTNSADEIVQIGQS